MAGNSKRQLKKRDKVSLKHKSSALPFTVLDETAKALLSEELQKEGVPDLVLVKDKKAERAEKEKRKAAAAAADAEACTTKAERRKLEQIRRKKESQARLAESFQQLEQTKLSSEAMGLLQGASMRGAKETRQQQLKRSLQMQRAGLAVPEDSRLFVRAHDGEAERDPLSEPPASAAGERARKTPLASASAPLSPRAAAGPARAPKRSSLSDDSSEDDDDDAPPVKRDLSSVAPPVQVTFKKRVREEEEDEEDPAAAERRRQEQLAERRRLAALVEEVKRSEGLTEAPDEGLEPPPRVRSVPSAGVTRVRYVQRDPAVQAGREGLPILAMEQEVLEAVDEHDVVLLCGETGCGKSTQVPQFLLEAGYGCADFAERAGMVGVTQPRRVAAVSTAKRVAAELASEIGGCVGYHVRYDAVAGADTAIKFMTDGILMRELQADFLLRKYSVIVIDEAHERSLNTDLLLGMLSRIVPQRRAQHQATKHLPDADRVFPLKLIIMSATLRIDDFLANDRLFPPNLYPGGPPPVINVPARQYPVLVHFSKRTELDDYVGAAYKKVARIHRELPPGGILVFLTGQREVQQLCARIKNMFPGPHRAVAGGRTGAAKAGAEPLRRSTPAERAGQRPGEGANGEGMSVSAAMELDGADRAEVDAHLLEAGDEEDADIDFDALADDLDTSDDEEEEEVVQLGGVDMTPEELAAAEKHFEERYGLRLPPAAAPTADGSGPSDGQRDELKRSEQTPVHVLPLFAMLPPEQQAAVFHDPPVGHRLIVVATNVAETSLTIPGIRYVVDAGRAKAKLLEPQAGLHRFEVRWISKASGDQRAGRAGRTGPGHCYRLFSSACFNDLFPAQSPPEILNTALEGVVLVMRAMGLPKILNFPFPTPPDTEALRAAERCLVHLSALAPTAAAASLKLATGAQLELTALGRAMAALPISPRHSRMLLEAAAIAAARAGPSQPDVLPHALALAAAVSSEPPFLHSDGEPAAAPAPPSSDPAVAAKQRIARDNESNALRNKVRAAHHRLRSPLSDALSALNALIAFEACPPRERAAFCKDHFLHVTILNETSSLRAQLVRVLGMSSALKACAASGHAGAEFLVARAAAGAGEGAGQLDAPLAPPGAAAATALRRCLAAGWPDQVARRMRSAEHVAQHNAGKARAVSYQPCTSEDTVFMHPRSALHAVAPDYVVYLALARTEKRTYMSSLTAVEAAWLADGSCGPLAARGDLAREPPPFYSRARDGVLAWCEVSYGAHAWPLPLHAVPHPDATERCGCFAAALLGGDVLPALARLAPSYNCKPAMARSPEGRALQRVSELVAALAAARVDSLEALRARWRADPAFLRPQVAAWMQKAHAGALDAVWPLALAEAESKNASDAPRKKKKRVK